MTNDDLLERNVERLIRTHAVSPSPKRARRDFLRRLAEPAPAPGDSRVRFLPAAAATLLVCGTILWAVWSERAPSPTPGSAVSSIPFPVLPGVASLPAVAEFIPVQAQSDGRVKLSVRVLGDPPRVAIKGASALPSGVGFRIAVRRSHEKFSAGRLQEVWEEIGGKTEPLVDGKFECVVPHAGPGPYIVRAEASLENQRKELLPALQTGEANRTGSTRVGLWNDALLRSLADGLAEVSALAREAAALAGHFESAAATPAAWKENKETLLNEAQALLTRIGKADKLRAVYPASLHEIAYAMGDLKVTSSYYTWKEGRFDGATSYYQKPGEKMKTYRDEEFGFDRLRGYFAEADFIAGRELVLWIVKDLRQGGSRSLHPEVIKEQALHPGVEPFAARIAEARPESLDELEREVRTLPARK